MTLTPSQAAALKDASHTLESHFGVSLYGHHGNLLRGLNKRGLIHRWWEPRGGWRHRITPLGLAALREWEEAKK